MKIEERNKKTAIKILYQREMISKKSMKTTGNL